MAQTLTFATIQKRSWHRDHTLLRSSRVAVRACGLCDQAERTRPSHISQLKPQLRQRGSACQSQKQSGDANEAQKETAHIMTSNLSPSASVEAFEQFGAAKGIILMAWRIARCNPFRGGYQGQYDPPKWPPVGLEMVFRQ